MAYQIFKTPKDPDSETNYGRNYGPDQDTGDPGWLSDTDTIETSNWTINSYEDPITLSITSQGIDSDGKSTYFWVEGGTDGVNYKLTNRITTAESITDDKTSILYVKSK